MKKKNETKNIEGEEYLNDGMKSPNHKMNAQNYCALFKTRNYYLYVLKKKEKNECDSVLILFLPSRRCVCVCVCVVALGISRRLCVCVFFLFCSFSFFLNRFRKMIFDRIHTANGCSILKTQNLTHFRAIEVFIFAWKRKKNKTKKQFSDEIGGQFAIEFSAHFM